MDVRQDERQKCMDALSRRFQDGIGGKAVLRFCRIESRAAHAGMAGAFRSVDSSRYSGLNRCVERVIRANTMFAAKTA